MGKLCWPFPCLFSLGNLGGERGKAFIGGFTIRALAWCEPCRAEPSQRLEIQRESAKSSRKRLKAMGGGLAGKRPGVYGFPYPFWGQQRKSRDRAVVLKGNQARSPNSGLATGRFWSGACSWCRSKVRNPQKKQKRRRPRGPKGRPAVFCVCVCAERVGQTPALSKKSSTSSSSASLAQSESRAFDLSVSLIWSMFGCGYQR